MHPESTCWTLIQGAAAGDRVHRDEFVRRYVPAVRAYLAARWRSPARRALVDDGVQDVFVECFRKGGVLGRADAERAGGFRAFLYGVVKNVALRYETKQARERGREEALASDFDLDALPASEQSLSEVFDRAWAKAIVGEAAALQAARARAEGEPAIRRAELLRLRFFDGLPIRDIARLWSVNPATLHHEYAKARVEFHDALRSVLAFDDAGTEEELAARCTELLALLDRS